MSATATEGGCKKTCNCGKATYCRKTLALQHPFKNSHVPVTLTLYGGYCLSRRKKLEMIIMLSLELEQATKITCTFTVYLRDLCLA